MRMLKNQRSRGGGGGGRRSKKLGNRRAMKQYCNNIGGKKFSEKLVALKSLLPPSVSAKHRRQDADVEEGSGSGETEQLFQETADYIVQLRTQVVVLQKLIKIYGSSDHTEDNFVL